MIEAINKRYEESLLVFLPKDVAIETQAQISSVEFALKALEKNWTGERVEKLNKNIASGFVSKIAKHSEEQLSGIESFGLAMGLIQTNANSHSFGLNSFYTPRIRKVLELSTSQAAYLIKTIQRKHLDAIANITYKNMQAGMRHRTITKEIADYGVTTRHAKFIARDQTAKINGAIAREKYLRAGFEYFKWKTSGDARVRQSHREVANRKTKYGVGVYRWDDLPLVGKEHLAPTQDYQCFPYSEKIDVFYGVEKLYRFSYRGELTEIVMDNGTTLKTTPNHPILTPKGFIRAQELDVGDNIVYIPKQRFCFGEVNGESANIPIGEVFTAYAEFFTPKSDCASAGNFYGDVTEDKEIDVVSVDWSLLDYRNATRTKDLTKLFLERANKMFGLVNETRYSKLVSLFRRVLFTSDGIVRLSCQFIAFFERCLAHADVHGFASIRRCYSILLENAGNDVTADFELFGNLLNADVPTDERLNLLKRYFYSVWCVPLVTRNRITPRAQAFTNDVGVNSNGFTSPLEGLPIKHEVVCVKKKRTRVFTGHVYDLQMKNGLFVMNSIAVSNCRCVALPVPNFMVKEYQERRKKKDEN